MSDEAPAAPGRSKPNPYIPWIILGVLLVASSFFRLGPGRQGPHIPQPLPPLMVEGWLNGPAPADQASLSKGLVVVDCWATWCGPCLQSLPRLAMLHANQPAAATDVRWIGLTSEPSSEMSKIQGVIDGIEGFTWPVGYGARPMFDALGVEAIPTMILFKDGKSVWSGHGVGELERALEAAAGA